MSSRAALALGLLLLSGCACMGQSAAYPTAADLAALEEGQVDLSGIERNGARTDVVPDYWARSFSSLGERDTFRLFSAKHDALRADDPAEADAALKSFRRLCRLGYRMDEFDRFWAGRPG